MDNQAMLAAVLAAAAVGGLSSSDDSLIDDFINPATNPVIRQLLRIPDDAAISGPGYNVNTTTITTTANNHQIPANNINEPSRKRVRGIEHNSAPVKRLRHEDVSTSTSASPSTPDYRIKPSLKWHLGDLASKVDPTTAAILNRFDLSARGGVDFAKAVINVRYDNADTATEADFAAVVARLWRLPLDCVCYNATPLEFRDNIFWDWVKRETGRDVPPETKLAIKRKREAFKSVGSPLSLAMVKRVDEMPRASVQDKVGRWLANVVTV